MAYSYYQTTATGTSQILSVPPYIDRSHISVLLDGFPTTSFSWLTDNTISITATAGVLITVKRSSSPSARVTDYVDGVPLTERALDNDSLQAFYLAQEAADVLYTVPLPQANSVLGWDAEGVGLINIPAATGTSLVTLGSDTGSALVGHKAVGVGASTRTVQAKLRESVSVLDFGAIGDGVTDNTAVFTAATATNQPIYVPQSSSFYSLTTLTSTQQKLLYGPGIVKVSGTQVQISSEPHINNDSANLRVYNQDLQPSKWSSVDGSLFNGAVSISAKRTGGFGSYGLNLTDYLISAAIPSTQFDVAATTWATAQNLAGAGSAVFGAWFGANTPSSSLSQTFTGGAAIGCEVNVGNRWADFGLQSDVGGTRYTVGLQVVPDVLPAADGTTAAIYPSSFGVLIGPSIHGHKWWTGSLISTNAIMPGGVAHQVNGGSTVPNAAGAALKASNNFVRGIDFNGATFSSQAILFGASQVVSWGGSGMSGTATTFGVSTGAGTGEGGLYANNYAQLAMRWSSSGSAAQLGFFGSAVTGKPTATGSRGANAALASLLTALSTLGLVTDSTS